MPRHHHYVDAPPVQPRADRALIGVLGVCSGVGVGLVYFPQALMHEIAISMEIPASAAAGAVAAPQLGYAVGILVLVPLVDRGRVRRLIVTCLFGAAVSALLAAGSKGTSTLVSASLALGCCAVVAPIAAAFAASRIPHSRRGRVGAFLLASSVIGIVVARAAATAATPDTWRVGYLVAAGTSCLVALCAWHALPSVVPTPKISWRRLLLRPAGQVRTRPELRRSIANQMGMFAAFTATWSTAELTLVNDLGYQDGALAVINAASLITVAAVAVAGIMTDRHGPDRVNSASFLGMAVAAAVLCGVGLGGLPGLLTMVAGVILVDVAMQTGMVANVTRNYATNVEAAGAANTAYMASAFAAGSVGSWCAPQLYTVIGWHALPVLILSFSSVPALLHLQRRRLSKGEAP